MRRTYPTSAEVRNEPRLGQRFGDVPPTRARRLARDVGIGHPQSAHRSSPGKTTKDGAFMEPRGCNRWQSVANRIGAEAAKTSENRIRGLRPVACDVPW